MGKNGEGNSKANKFDDIDYNLEYLRNELYWDLGSQLFHDYIERTDQSREDDKKLLEKVKVDGGCYIPIRVKDALIAVTDDLCRYANYHNVKKTEKGELSIDEAVRASFFVKWIMNFRPCCLDRYINELKYSSLTLYGDSIDYEEYHHIGFFCNEYLATYIASRILDIDIELDEEKEEEPIWTILHLMQPEEIKPFFYNLRYRLNHQDTYHLLFKHINEKRI